MVTKSLEQGSDFQMCSQLTGILLKMPILELRLLNQNFFRAQHYAYLIWVILKHTKFQKCFLGNL